VTRTWYRVVLPVWVCAVLMGYAASAEEAQPLQPCVLVLPLQASPEMSGDQVFLGVAVQNVLEDILAVHSTLEECWALRFLHRLFHTSRRCAIGYRAQERYLLRFLR
jgi:hypothetical protein